MTNGPSLVDKMRALAADGHAQAAELIEKANALEEATRGFYAEPQTVETRRFFGCWARARRLWCDVSGDPLI